MLEYNLTHSMKGPLLLTLLLTLGTCLQVGGYIGAVYPGQVDVSQLNVTVKEVLRFSTMYRKISLTAYKFKVGFLEDGTPLFAYIIPGNGSTLILVETDYSLDEAPYYKALAALTYSGAIGHDVVKVYRGLNTISPPLPVVLWLRDQGERVRPIENVCLPAKGDVDKRKGVAVVSNEIDRKISYPLLEEAFKSLGVEVTWHDGSELKEVMSSLDYSAVIVLGGPLSLGSGKISSIILGKKGEELLSNLKLGKKSYLIYRSDNLFVLAGTDRYATREAVKEFVEEGWPKKLFSEGGTIRESGNYTLSVIRSVGSCRAGSSEGFLAYTVDGAVRIIYREGAPNPCYRHRVKSFTVDPVRREVLIELELVRTEQICIQCLGSVETVLELKPAPEGEWTIVVNGYSAKIKIAG